MTLNSSLLQWLSTFKLDAQSNTIDYKKDDAYYKLADGFVCAKILNQISPLYFSDKWLDGIIPVALDGSWRLRVSNLKRILQKIHDYESDLQSPQFRPKAILPDVAVIAQNFDPDQISRLIQLILFVAINSDKKQDYIEKIRKDLPTQVQQDIKEAIEELLDRGSDDNYKIDTSHAGNESVNSESNFDTRNSTLGHNSSTNPSHSTPTKSPAYRAHLRRDSSQISSDISRRNESHHDISTHSAYDHNSNETVEEIRHRLSAALAIKEERAQACHDLELKIKRLQLEKDQLASENERLTSEKSNVSNKSISSPRRLSESSRQVSTTHRELDDAISDIKEVENKFKKMDDYEAQNLILLQNKKLQIELHRLKEDLIRVETEKEDFRLKSNLLKEDLERMTTKRDELRLKAEQVKKLQDELDEHRQMSEKVVSYETMMENLVKKNNDMKKELKSLEEKNVSHIHKIVRLEEENKQLTSTISRIELYKKQLQESQVKLSQETHRADKAEVELTRLSEKYSATRKENERLYETTNQLMKRGSSVANKDPQPQLDRTSSTSYHDATSKMESSTSGGKPQFSDKTSFDGVENQPEHEALNSLSTSMIELKERLARLEYENELLQDKLNSKRENDHTVLGGLLENANSRCTKLEVENRQSRKKILMLESRLKDLMMSPPNGASTSGAHEAGSSALAHASVADTSSDNTLALMNRVEELQRALFKKEQELTDSETKYKRNIQKAKDVIKALNNNQSISGNSLHPSHMSSASPFNSSSLDETNLLKQQLKDREERLIEMEREFYEFKKFKEIHERLIMSAFYGLTTPMQWKNAERRLERTTLTSPPNTASSSINHSKHSH